VSGDHRFTFKFSQIECAGCGSVRIRSVECPDCGRRPDVWEVDPSTERRRKLARRLETMLSAEVAGDSTLGVFDVMHADVFSELGSWLPRFLTGLRVALESDCRDTEQMLGAVDALLTLRRQAAGVPVQRPFLVPGKAAAAAIDQADGLVRAYAASLGAAIPLHVQQAGADGQRQIDLMAGTAEALADWIARADAFAEGTTVAETLDLLVKDGMREFGVSTLVELDRAALTALSKLLRLDVNETGLGVAYAHCSAIAAVIFDQDRFARTMHETVRLFRENRKVLAKLSANKAFLEDFARLELELFDSAWTCQRVIQTSAVPRQSARAIVDLHGSLVESAGRLVCSALLLASRVKSAPYEKLRQANATELLQRAQREPELMVLLEGLDDHLRTAHAHRSVTYLDDMIVTDLKSGRREISIDDLVNQTLQGMESTLALLMGIRVAAAVNGLDVHAPAALDAFGVSVEEVVTFMLGAMKGIDAIVRREGDSLHVQVSAASPEGFSGALGAAAMSIPSDPELTYRLELSSGTTISCPVSAYRQFSTAEGEAAQSLALVRIQRSWRTDAGKPHMPDDVVRRWIAHQALEDADADFRARMQALRQLKAFAEAEGLGDVVEMLRGLMRLTRLMATEGRATAEELGALRTLERWRSLASPLMLI
jgi:hypothetical protein